MAELTPEQLTQGIFLDAAGNPTMPDGTPVESPKGVVDVMASVVNGWKPNQYQAPDPNVARQYALEANTGGLFRDAAGNLTDSSGVALSEYVRTSMEAQTPANADPVSYGIGPSYGASSQKYYGPVLDPGIWLGEPESTDTSQMLDYSGGGSFPTNWEDYKSNNRTTGGGFFTLEQLFGSSLPTTFQSGANAPSTNNYRLLPSEYRNPRYIMRNGQIIDTQSDTVYGPYGHGEFGGRYENPRWRSGEALGVPSAHAFGSIAGTVFGWPGQIQGYGWINPAN